MIVFCIYLLLFLGLLYFNGFFGLFSDEHITKKQFTLLFLGKALAIPAFLFVYTKIYGGIENFDTGKFYHDAKLISDYGKTDPGFLIRLLFGFQDDSPGSHDYEAVLKHTLNWDNGKVKDYLYNDNRVVIRVHAFLNFPAFGIYSAHALFNCFLSFIGILYCYKAFKQWFAGKEILMMVILCFFPALWFYTGALLKEGVTFFVLGCTLYQLKNMIEGNYRVLTIAWLIFLIYLSFLIKPYLLIFSIVCFGLFFIIFKSGKIKSKIVVFFSVIALSIIAANLISIAVKHKSMLAAALKYQRQFIGVSRGGIFVTDTTNFIRLTNDTTQIKRVVGKKDIFKIKENVSYMYWRTREQMDTLYTWQNKDTITYYRLVYSITPGNSNVTLPDKGPVSILLGCLYYTLFYPQFYNAHSALQVLASFENLAILLAFLIVFIGFFKRKKETFLPLVFVFFALSLCLLIGLTAPNSGAIFRYRSPAIIFLLLSALYYLPGHGLFKKYSGTGQ